jgi:DNA repair exonuclease SbcCD nuclease subunit
MKFIHAADLHIDSPLHGLSAHDGAPVELLRTATRSAFSALIDRAIDLKVAFVILAGDIFDGAWRDFNTPIFFGREMARLDSEGIFAIIVRGNHDAEHEMTKNLPLPPNVKVFGSDAPETFRLEFPDVRVALHGQSFKRAETTENLVRNYPARIEDWLNIGVLHTGLQGQTKHAPYAPCSVEELKNKGMDYFALGHIHKAEIICESPWIVMPGNLPGRHINETGPRGAMLVTYENGELQRPERLLVDVVRWALAEVDISAARTRTDAVALAGTVFRRIMEQESDGRPVACRVVFVGRSPAHGSLFGQERTLRAELMAQAINVAGDNLWIEKIKVSSKPAVDTAVIAERGDALGELQTMLVEAAQEPAFIASLEAEFGPLLGKIDLDVFTQDVPALKAVKSGNFAHLISEVTPSVIDLISRVD